MLLIQVTNAQQQLQISHRAGRLQFGRIVRSGPEWVTLLDDYVSREQLELEEVNGRLTVCNLSKRVPIVLSTGRTVSAGECATEPLPLAMQVGATTLRVDLEQDLTGTLMTIGEPARPKDSKATILPLKDITAGPDATTLLSWFETIISVQRAAAGSPEFYQETAKAVVELVGLDYGMVLLRKGDEWERKATYSASEHARTAFSQTILHKMRQDGRTYYQVPELDTSASLVDVSSVVASPIFDPNGKEIVGAVYGARTSRSSGLEVEIKQVEAQLVQVLAAAVGAGLARLGSERVAQKRHEQFELFFSPELASELDRDPELLEGREREISVLFADIRNFTRISEPMDAKVAVQLVGSVMDALTRRIREFKGVLVSYLGDGLLAMWNAPVDQPDHAALACRAGLALISELPDLNKLWEPRIKQPLRLGVGVNTGLAVVGNTGSQQKLHYGPLGHTVNLASRVEGATKQLGVPMLITRSTHDRLENSFASRRLCKVRVVGIAEPVELYELHPPPAPSAWRDRRDAYEAALIEYEGGRWSEAGRLLQPFLSEAGEYDVPTLTLLGRSLECLKQPPAQFDGVWELHGK